MPTDKIPPIEQMLPNYWGEPERWEEARTMAAISQAHSLERIAAATETLAGLGLEIAEELTSHMAVVARVAEGDGSVLEILRADSEEPIGTINIE